MLKNLLFIWVFVCVDQFGHELGEFPDMNTCKSYAAGVDGYCVGRKI